MLSVHLEKGKVTVIKRRKPRKRKGEALIRLLCAGICNTDLELQRGYYNFRGIPGHEFVGDVLEADKQSLVGRRVVGEINLACGRCGFCRQGLRRHCPNRSVLGIDGKSGAFREYFTLPETNLHVVPRSVSNESATFVEPLAAILALSNGCGSSSNPPPANRAPVAVNPGSQTGAAGEPASLQIKASDADGDSLRFTARGMPTGLQIHSLTGLISGSYGTAGNFAVAVTVTDGDDSVRVEFSWNVVMPLNDPPVAQTQLLFVEFDTSRAVVLAGSDPENDPLTFDIVENPTSGNLSGVAPNLTYTPDPGFSGTDSLQFTVWDGEYTSDPAVVTIIVRSEGVKACNILLIIMDDIGMDTSSQMHPGLIEELTEQYGPQGHNHYLYRRITGSPASTAVLNTLAQEGIPEFSNRS